MLFLTWKQREPVFQKGSVYWLGRQPSEHMCSAGQAEFSLFFSPLVNSSVDIYSYHQSAIFVFCGADQDLSRSVIKFRLSLKN
jgi:hypothetical protein